MLTTNTKISFCSIHLLVLVWHDDANLVLVQLYMMLCRRMNMANIDIRCVTGVREFAGVLTKVTTCTSHQCMSSKRTIIYLYFSHFPEIGYMYHVILSLSASVNGQKLEDLFQTIITHSGRGAVATIMIEKCNLCQRLPCY